MNQPLLSREERHRLTNDVLFSLSLEAATARRLALRFTCTTGRIHSVLVSLRAEGVIEAIALASENDMQSPRELLWGLTDHGYLHGVEEGVATGGRPTCKHCLRRFAAWT